MVGPYDDMPCKCRNCGEEYDLKDCFNEVYTLLELNDRVDDLPEFFNGELCSECNMDEWYTEMFNMMRRRGMDPVPENIGELDGVAYGD